MTTVDLTEYSAAHRAFDLALDKLARETVAFDLPAFEPAERLELLRLTLHRAIDDVLDAEALRHPSPLRPICRTSRYIELLHEVRGAGLTRCAA